MASSRRPGKSPSRRPGGAAPNSRRRPAPASSSGKPAEVQKKRSPRFTGRAVILVSVVLLLLASYTSTLHAWWDQRQEIQSLRAQNVIRKDNIAELNDQKDRWNDPAFIKQQARARFGWVMPGEVGYRVIGIDGHVQGEVPALAVPDQAAEAPWYDKLWGSVEQAGKAPEPSKPATPKQKPLKTSS